MLEIRLKRRLRSLDMSSFAEYCDHVFRPDGQDNELVHLIDVVTTNKTDFFREPAISTIWSRKRCRIWRRAMAPAGSRWSGAPAAPPAKSLTRWPWCSASMPQARPGFRFSVLATDISTAVLAKARMGIFKSELVSPVPRDLRRKYFMRSRDPDSDLVRVVPELRALVEFRRLNFMDSDFGLPRAAGNHLLPERHHLFRPAHPGAASGKAHPATGAGRIFFRGPFRIACKAWTCR